MNNTLRHPFRISELSKIEALSNSYDLFLAGLGFEDRARAVSKIYTGEANKKIAVAFPDRQVLSFQKNLEFFKKKEFQINNIADEEMREWWVKELEASIKSAAIKGRPFRLCIDISSQSRTRLAQIVEGIMCCSASAEIEVDFIYCLAKFSEPSGNADFAESCGPVSSFFAGWPNDPELPVAAIMGLGYEKERAIGACEYLEPAMRMLLVPVSIDPRYDTGVKQANKTLLDEVSPSHTFQYHVEHPLEGLGILDGLVYGLLRTSRVTLLPFGPKIFALTALITASTYFPDVGVWRVSTGIQEEPIQRFASDSFAGLRVLFSKRQAGPD